MGFSFLTIISYEFLIRNLILYYEKKNIMKIKNSSKRNTLTVARHPIRAENANFFASGDVEIITNVKSIDWKW